MVKLNIKNETMMLLIFRKGIVLGPFSESLIRNRPKTFCEIRCQVVAHIVAERDVTRSAHALFPRAREHQVDVSP